MRKPNQPVAPEAIQTIKDWQSGKAKKYGNNENITPSQPKWFASYPYMIAIMAVLQVLGIVYGRKMIVFLGFNTTAGGLILLPIVLYIFQIVSECYGWQYARQIIWCNFIINVVVTAVSYLFKEIPFSEANHANLQTAYMNLMDTMWVSAVLVCLFMFLSDYITSALMCWSRFQWNGRFMIIRMVLLHCLSEAILLSALLISFPYNGYSLIETIGFIKTMFIARSIFACLLFPFARYIIWYIQNRVEKVVVFDYKKEFNPFKFGIDPQDSVQFNADGWAKINVGKIDIKKLGQAYSDEFFEEHERQIKERIEQNNKQH
jgi:uncharacterized PurR-regulated membrane protein YhhQ (DUF165 family)